PCSRGNGRLPIGRSGASNSRLRSRVTCAQDIFSRGSAARPRGTRFFFPFCGRLDEEAETGLVKITQRLAVWAETSAKIWADHLLLIVGSALVFASAVLNWAYFAFSRHPLGLQ